jgi:hypothetical protein
MLSNVREVFVWRDVVEVWIHQRGRRFSGLKMQGISTNIKHIEVIKSKRFISGRLDQW